MAAWLGLAGVVLGAVITGLSTHLEAAKQSTRERRAEARRRRIAAMEEIYELLSATLSMAAKFSLGMNKSIRSDAVFVQDQWIDKTLKFDRLRMLIDFYVPPLKSDMDAISVQLHIIGSDGTAVENSGSLTGVQKVNITRTTYTAMSEMSRLAFAAQRKLSQEMHKLNDDI